jgi:hypothetical protein
MVRIISKTFFYCSIVFLIFFLWTITGGQKVNIEFRDSNIRNQFYSTLFIGTPIAILLTLFGSIRRTHSRTKKVLTFITTGTLSIASFFFILDSMLKIGFGDWSTMNIMYENKRERSIQIREQQFDIGALGYGGKRVVEVSPFLLLFWKANPVDTGTIDKTQWIPVGKE